MPTLDHYNMHIKITMSINTTKKGHITTLVKMKNSLMKNHKKHWHFMNYQIQKIKERYIIFSFLNQRRKQEHRKKNLNDT